MRKGSELYNSLFIGVCLGWLPGVILGAIAYFLFYYGWGPLLVAGAVAGLASLNQ